MSPRVADIMSTEMLSVHPSETVDHVLGRFAETGFQHALVQSHGQLLGVIEQGYLLRRLLPYAREVVENPGLPSPLDERAEDVMMAAPITVQPQHPAWHAVKLLMTEGLACLPVVTREGQPFGIVTAADVLREVVLDGTFEQGSEAPDDSTAV